MSSPCGKCADRVPCGNVVDGSATSAEVETYSSRGTNRTPVSASRVRAVRTSRLYTSQEGGPAGRNNETSTDGAELKAECRGRGDHAINQDRGPGRKGKRTRTKGNEEKVMRACKRELCKKEREAARIITPCRDVREAQRRPGRTVVRGSSEKRSKEGDESSNSLEAAGVSTSTRRSRSSPGSGNERVPGAVNLATESGAPGATMADGDSRKVRSWACSSSPGGARRGALL